MQLAGGLKRPLPSRARTQSTSVNHPPAVSGNFPGVSAFLRKCKAALLLPPCLPPPPCSPSNLAACASKLCVRVQRAATHLLVLCSIALSLARGPHSICDWPQAPDPPFPPAGAARSYAQAGHGPPN
jgi:hypothetical protein